MNGGLVNRGLVNRGLVNGGLVIQSRVSQSRVSQSRVNGGLLDGRLEADRQVVSPSERGMFWFHLRDQGLRCRKLVWSHR